MGAHRTAGPEARLVSVVVVMLSATAGTDARALVPQGGTQPDDLTVPFLAPEVCAECHDYGEPQSPYRTWAGSMMANSARDPLMHAALAIAEQDVPEVGDMCLRCHAPVGWLGGRVTDGSPPPTHGESLTDDDLQGVTCHLCHRMTDGPNHRPYSENAQLFIADDDVRRGPWKYPFPGSTFTPPHDFAASTFHTSAAICGQCHDVSNPLVPLRDGRGRVVASTFPVERTYAEWKASAFAQAGGQTCQDCHMPSTPGPARACSWGSAPTHDLVPRHEFVGGNAWMPTVLDGENPDLERTANFAATRAAALDMLQHKSATVALSASSNPRAGGQAVVRVRVTNLTGHKLPTGYPEGRRVWIRLTVKAGDTTLLHSGAYDDGIGDLVPDASTKVYEARQGISGQGPSFHFVLNDTIFKDNRIPPRGFVSDLEIAPVGASFATLPGGILAHYDDTDYPFSIPAGTRGPLSVKAEVLYQTATRPYVEFLRDTEQTKGAGSHAYDLWQRYDRSPPVVMASAAMTITLTSGSGGYPSGYQGGYEGSGPSWPGARAFTPDEPERSEVVSNVSGDGTQEPRLIAGSRDANPTATPSFMASAAAIATAAALATGLVAAGRRTKR